MPSSNPSLAHDASSEAFAEAMVQCQGYAVACSTAHECLKDGECFTSSARGYKAALSALDDLISHASTPHARSWLIIGRNAMEFQRSMERQSKQ